MYNLNTYLFNNQDIFVEFCQMVSNPRPIDASTNDNVIVIKSHFFQKKNFCKISETWVNRMCQTKIIFLFRFMSLMIDKLNNPKRVFHSHTFVFCFFKCGCKFKIAYFTTSQYFIAILMEELSEYCNISTILNCIINVCRLCF